MLEWLNEAEVNTVIMTQKRIEGPIHWTQKRDTFVYSFKVPITCEDLPLTLEGTYNMRMGNISLKIMYAGVQRAKALDIGRTHRNPNGEKIGRVTRKHKHTWTDEHQDQWVYDPDDITTGAAAEQVFAEFLTECNISYKSTFSMPTHQMGLDL